MLDTQLISYHQLVLRKKKGQGELPGEERELVRLRAAVAAAMSLYNVEDGRRTFSIPLKPQDRVIGTTDQFEQLVHRE